VLDPVVLDPVVLDPVVLDPVVAVPFVLMPPSCACCAATTARRTGVRAVGFPLPRSPSPSWYHPRSAIAARAGPPTLVGMVEPLEPAPIASVRVPGSDGCVSCGSHLAVRWSTPEGTALLCRECATLHGLGCP
jgi:hypothetical protein